MSDSPAMPAPASSAVMLAVERLNLSRQHLQRALMPPTRTSGHRAAPDRPALIRWLDRLVSTPTISVLVGTLQRWWSRHPMRLPLLVAADAAQSLIGPVAKKQPYLLVLGAAAAGASLVLSRPWRWLPRAMLTPALLTGLLPTLIEHAVSPATNRTA